MLPAFSVPCRLIKRRYHIVMPRDPISFIGRNLDELAVCHQASQAGSRGTLSPKPEALVSSGIYVRRIQPVQCCSALHHSDCKCARLSYVLQTVGITAPPIDRTGVAHRLRDARAHGHRSMNKMRTPQRGEGRIRHETRSCRLRPFKVWHSCATSTRAHNTTKHGTSYDFLFRQYFGVEPCSRDLRRSKWLRAGLIFDVFTT